MVKISIKLRYPIVKGRIIDNLDKGETIITLIASNINRRQKNRYGIGIRLISILLPLLLEDQSILTLTVIEPIGDRQRRIIMNKYLINSNIELMDVVV